MRNLDGKPHSDWAGVDAVSLTRLYEHYNRLYFRGRLPMVTIHLSEEEEDADFVEARYDRVSGSIYFYASHRTPDIQTTLLLHEMVHVAVPEEGHGARFRAGLQRLAEAGNKDAEFEVWRMVGDQVQDDEWIGEESGRWERYREGSQG
jgi:hypothetical protein